MACVGRGRDKSTFGGRRNRYSQRLDVGGNRAVAASTGDSIAVSRVVTECKEKCCPTFNRFGNVAVVKAASMFGGGSRGSAASLSGMS